MALDYNIQKHVGFRCALPNLRATLNPTYGLSVISRSCALLIVSPEPEYLDDSVLLQDLVHDTVLNIDSARKSTA